MARFPVSGRGRTIYVNVSALLRQFEGGLGVAWDFIAQKLDKDAENYAAKSIANQYGPYVREQEKRGLPTITREEWCALSDAERKRLTSYDAE